tara:strand:+ start:296 stop:583 length:288 start_codon:yes stop_codon:yes gene_type:complete
MEVDDLHNGDGDGDGEVEDGNVDYTSLVITDMYDIITTRPNPWSSKYTKLKKLEFLDKMLVYLKENQLYEMCAGIQKVKEDIINERIIKSKKNKR